MNKSNSNDFQNKIRRSLNFARMAQAVRDRLNQFASKGKLTEHQTAVHEGLKHHCRQCGHQFTSKGNLARHQKAVHEGVKHPCGQWKSKL